MTEQQVLDAIDKGNHDGGATGRFWALDPIDGTKGQSVTVWHSPVAFLQWADGSDVSAHSRSQKYSGTHILARMKISF
jgi:heme-degrading monooxygenase HmoA